MYADIVNHLTNKAKLKALDRDIERTKELSLQMQNDMDFHATSDFEEHRHKEGTHTDETSIIACKPVSDASMQLIEDLRELTVQRHRLALKIENVETALSFLDKAERLSVSYRDVERLSWEEVTFRCSSRTAGACKKTIEKHYKQAIRKIRPFFVNDAVGTDSSAEIG